MTVAERDELKLAAPATSVGNEGSSPTLVYFKNEPTYGLIDPALSRPSELGASRTKQIRARSLRHEVQLAGIERERRRAPSVLRRPLEAIDYQYFARGPRRFELDAELLLNGREDRWRVRRRRGGVRPRRAAMLSKFILTR